MIFRLLPLLLVACGTSNSGTDGGGTDGASDGNTTTMDGGGTTDGGIPATKYVGVVLVSSTNTSTSMRYDIFGTFEQPPTTSSSMNCTITPDGACSFYDCTNTDAGTSPTPTYLNAGALEVDVGANMIMPMQMANKEYRAVGNMPLFTGGEMVRAKATGDPMGAPAFDLSVTAPSRITMTQPTYPPMGGLQIARTGAYDLKWTGGTSGKVYASLATYPTGGYKAVACNVDASAGGITFPATSMAKLTAGGGYLAVSCLSQTYVVQGDWGLILEAYNTVVESGGRAVTLFSATVQ